VKFSHIFELADILNQHFVMKLKFALFTLLLLFSRGCDFYSTSLWFFDNPTGETNPLYRYFGIGWTGLIIVNIIIVGLVIYACFYFYFLYKRPTNLYKEPKNYRELASLQYFNSTDKFYQIFYKIPKNKKVLLAHTGYVLTVVIIIGGFLATIHNLSQYYDLNFYNQFRKIVGRPLFVIYGLILLTFFLAYRQLLIGEYRKYKNIS
jgi:hypothetical protein